MSQLHFVRLPNVAETLETFIREWWRWWRLCIKCGWNVWL